MGHMSSDASHPTTRGEAIDRLRLLACLQGTSRDAPLKKLRPYTGLPSMAELEAKLSDPEAVYELIANKTKALKNAAPLIARVLDEAVGNWSICEETTDIRFSGVGLIIEEESLLSHCRMEKCQALAKKGGEFIELDLHSSELRGKADTKLIGSKAADSTLGARKLILEECSLTSSRVQSDGEVRLETSKANSVIFEKPNTLRVLEDSEMIDCGVTAGYFFAEDSAFTGITVTTDETISVENSSFERCAFDFKRIDKLLLLGCEIRSLTIIQESRPKKGDTDVSHCRIKHLDFFGSLLEISYSKLESLEAADGVVRLIDTDPPPGWKLNKQKFLVRA